MIMTEMKIKNHVMKIICKCKVQKFTKQIQKDANNTK